MKKILFSLFSFLCFAPLGLAGTITGQIQTPSTGRGVPNGTLTFTLSQAAVVSGTATLAANGNCWTDSNGNVVGLPGDAAVAAPVLSSNLGSGSLGAGTYYVRYTWANATGEAQASAERSLTLTSAGTLIVQAPTSVPATSTAMKVYIGSASGAETFQGSVAVTNGVLAGNYSQTVVLAAGAALPSSNTSACQIRFNDELQPSYTAYWVALTNVNGAAMAGFPQKWYLSGGSNGTVNVSLGTPLYSGVVQYPQAIVANPAASGQQSMNGPLSLNGFTFSNALLNGIGQINSDLWVGNGIGQYLSMAACAAALLPGQNCNVPEGWSETWSSNLTISTSNNCFIFHGNAAINQGAFSLLVNDGVTGFCIVGPYVYGSPIGNAGTRFVYTGSGNAWQWGSSSGTSSIQKPLISNVWLDLTGAGSAAVGINGFAVGKFYFSNLLIVLSATAGNTQKGLALNNNLSNFSGGGTSIGLLVAQGQIAIQLNGSTVENTFIETILAGGSIAGSIGIDIEGPAASNVFTGGFVTAYLTALNFGGNTNHNVVTIEADGATTDVAFGPSTARNEVVRMNSAGQPTPVISLAGTYNLVRSPGGIIFAGGNLLSNQGLVAQQTGNSADQVIYTCTLPGNVMVAGKGVRIRWWVNHTNGNGLVTYKITFGGTVVAQFGPTDTSLFKEYLEATVVNNAGVTNAQTSGFLSFNSVPTVVVGPANPAIDTTSNVVINATFNAANTEKVTGQLFTVEAVQ